VRSHLEEINKRLRDGGPREIYPSDSTMKERYSF
jgi:hypothetical protein